MKQKFLALLLSLLVVMSADAQKPLNIRDVFRTMPDSLAPYLTTNNRLDMMDFMDARMKSVVTNSLDGQTEMLALTDDSLSLRLNPCVLLDLWLVPVDTGRVVALRRTYQVSDRQHQVVEERFTPDWRPLSRLIGKSTLLRRDDDVLNGVK
ncbi:MAG: DUF3256 family protein [Prevotella sp.]|nr:DUF3256 family protein [Prevotella sp.]